MKKVLNDVLSKVDTFYHAFILFHIDETYFLTNDEISKLLNSQYRLDGLLLWIASFFECFIQIKEQTSIHSFDFQQYIHDMKDTFQY